MKRMMFTSKKSVKSYYSVKIINKLPSKVVFRCEDKNFLFIKTFSIRGKKNVTKRIPGETFLVVWSGQKLIGDYTLPGIDTGDSSIFNLFRRKKKGNNEMVLTVTENMQLQWQY